MALPSAMCLMYLLVVAETQVDGRLSYLIARASGLLSGVMRHVVLSSLCTFYMSQTSVFNLRMLETACCFPIPKSVPPRSPPHTRLVLNIEPAPKGGEKPGSAKTGR